MAPPVELLTTRATPWLRAASRTLIVPATLIVASQAGFAIDLRTSICAARWKIASGCACATTSESASASRMSSTRNSTPPARACARFSSLPVERSSTTTTSSPRA
jgi:hypothetical protein